MTECVNTQSPFWLWFPEGESDSGTWVHLDGVSPQWEQEPDRGSSALTTYGGLRYVQVNRRVNREWRVSYEFATPEALAALQYAADRQGAVVLFDETAAASNMLTERDAYGDYLGDVLVVSGVPLPRIFYLSTSRVLLIPGRSYTFTLWTDQTEGEDVAGLLEVTEDEIIVKAPPGTGTRKVSVTFVADNPTLDIWLRPNATAGLMLTLGDTEPGAWTSGQRTPCPVSVGDASRKHVLNRTGACHSDRGRSRDDYTLRITEVGEMDVRAPTLPVE